MAACPKCGGNDKIRKRSDNWYHCKKHGRVRKVNSPAVTVTKITKDEVINCHLKKKGNKEVESKSPRSQIKVEKMNWDLQTKEN